MRIRTILFLTVAAFLLYRLLPASRKEALRDRLTGLGQAVVLSIVLYWIWLLGALAWRAWRG